MPRPDEFQIIADYFAPLASGAAGAFGLGDDAASYVPTPGKELVLTVDAIVEGVHFLATDPAADVARKLLRVNLSDLAAKGATPRGYLLTTAWTAATPVEWIAGFARGLAEDQSVFGLSLWGGDTVATPGPLSFTLTAIGEVEQGKMIRRSGGEIGDDLWVTGTIGDGALGLLVALGKMPASPELLIRYRVPQPRVAFGPKLVGLAHASLDVSDGLMADLGHLCQQSGTGARIDVASLPLSAAARMCLKNAPDLIETIMTGGDDYELLFSAAPDAVSAIDSVANQSGVQATRIGKLVSAGEGVNAFDTRGSALSFKRTGFRHF